MQLPDRIRKYENVHVGFWLLKDTCWMLELKWAGTIIMVPTLIVSLYIVWKTFKNSDVFINAAIFCWILANSFWMMMEFYNDNKHKNLAAIPFFLGFIFVSIFYYRAFHAKKSVE